MPNAHTARSLTLAPSLQRGVTSRPPVEWPHRPGGPSAWSGGAGLREPGPAECPAECLAGGPAGGSAKDPAGDSPEDPEGNPAGRAAEKAPEGRSRASQDLEWQDPVTGERLSIRLQAGDGLLGRLLRADFEASDSTPEAPTEAGPGAAA